MNKANRNKKAFTIVELLIATGVFSLFMLGVFSLYSTGSKMFMSGSWKYNKQKEAERFLQVLKERMEQASVPSKIVGEVGNYSIQKLPNIGFFVNHTNGAIELSDKKYLAEFIVSKPDTTLATGTEGLVLYHALFCESQGDGLFKLKLYVNDHTNGDINFLATSFGNYWFPPKDIDNFVNTASFTANPNDYSFSNIPHDYTLTDVQGVDLIYGITATGSTNLGSTDDTKFKKNPVVTLNITMQNPKSKDTTVTEKIVTKIDWSVYLCPVGFTDD